MSCTSLDPKVIMRHVRVLARFIAGKEIPKEMNREL